ncbi:MAG: SIMPL domain-containing protein [Thaumarchaeota archaeon]|nr:SIMPL domain-containing protein [Nitrososphaerota archaeon]
METVKKVAISLAMALAVALAALSSNAIYGSIVAQANSSEAPESTLHVVGYGEVLAEPDRAEIRISITSLNFSASDAVSAVAGIYDELCSKLNESGLDWDKKTLGYTIRPVYDYYGERRVLKGYRATHSLLITVVKQEDLGVEAGKAIDIISSVGNNLIDSVRFTVSEEELNSMKDQALALAMKNAKHKAELLAEAGGFMLVGVKSVSIGYEYRPLYPLYKGNVAEEAFTAPTVLAPSTVKVTSSVSVTYLIAS